MAKISASPSPVDAGDELTIEYSGGASGGSVTLDLDNGHGDERQVTVSLDESGNGSVTWTVPTTGWTVVNINGPDAQQETVIVDHPNEGS